MVKNQALEALGKEGTSYAAQSVVTYARTWRPLCVSFIECFLFFKWTQMCVLAYLINTASKHLLYLVWPRWCKHGLSVDMFVWFTVW